MRSYRLYPFYELVQKITIDNNIIEVSSPNEGQLRRLLKNHLEAISWDRSDSKGDKKVCS